MWIDWMYNRGVFTKAYAGGTVTKPAASKLFYVPQKPYLALGTFRDQVIYPDTAVQARERGYSDDELMKLLDVVHLGYLVEREGGWDAVQDWADVLSGGEKQRVAMARLFYHKPQFVSFDNSRSGIADSDRFPIRRQSWTNAPAQWASTSKLSCMNMLARSALLSLQYHTGMACFVHHKLYLC